MGLFDNGGRNCDHLAVIACERLDPVGTAAYGHIVALLLLVSGGVALMVVLWIIVWRLQRSSRMHPPGRRGRNPNYGRFG